MEYRSALIVVTGAVVALLGLGLIVGGFVCGMQAIGHSCPWVYCPLLMAPGIFISAAGIWVGGKAFK